ncbi:MAG: flippase-like domain-containing protein [Ferruginibacter sp.]|nr:flippase-like domain-containing protein [Cytophagales bacterium]
MQPNARRGIQLGVSLVLGAALLWYARRVIDPTALTARFREADYRWILLSGMLSVVAYWSRAERWRLLMEPLGYRPTTFHSALALMSGYFANLLLPRVGEVTRCGVLYRLDRIPVNVSFGTVVAERIFDLLMLLILVAFTFVLELDRLGTFFTGFFHSRLAPVFNNLSVITAVAFALLVGTGMLSFGLFRYRRAIRRSFLYAKGRNFLRGMAAGLLSVRKLRSPATFLFHTGLIWTMYYLMAYVLFFATPQTAGLGIRAGFTILVTGGLAMAVPVQGGFGTFHLLVGNVLVLYGLSLPDGIILATFMHTSQTLFVVLMGGLSSIVVLFLRGKHPSPAQSPPVPTPESQR